MTGSDRADRDFAQRALDVVKRATRSHDEEAERVDEKPAEDAPSDKKRKGAA